MDQPKQGLFSSLSLGRASRSSKPPAESLTHPLLGASTSSVNLPSTDPSAQVQTDANGNSSSSQPPLGHRSSGSWSRNGSAEVATNLPYKPRQRHGGGIGSAGSASGIFGPSGSTGAPPTIHHASSTSSIPTTATSSSPVTPTTAMPAPPTTATSTSATFALPPSASEPSAAQLSDPSSVPAALSSGSASLTSRLQLQSLKAAAQRIGLGNGSMGMSMIDAIFDKGQLGRTKPGEGGDWGDLLRVLMGGKAVLLLPTAASSSLPMTPQILRDHIAFLSPATPIASSSYTSKQPGNDSSDLSEKDPSAGFSNVFVTLSGLIGTMKGSTITFESTVSAEAPLLAALRDTSSRQTALSSLRSTYITTPSSSASFPTFTLSSDIATLPFPPPSKQGPASTSNDAKDKDRAPQGKFGRMNPFASLFGGSSHASPALGSSPHASQPSAPASPPRLHHDTLALDAGASPSRLASGDSLPSSPGPSSPRPSALNMDLADVASIHSDVASLSAAGEGYQVAAYTVSKPIRYTETHKSLTKAVRNYVREVLNKLPDKVIDKVVKLVLANVCPAASSSTNEDMLKGHKGYGSSDHDRVAVLHFDDPTETGERLQDFMEGIYDDLIAHYRAEGAPGSGLKRKGSVQGPWSRAEKASDGDEEDAKEKKEKARRDQEESAETEASEGTERVEGLVCRLLYNRLFSPLESDDAKHDEALASRIAALNMLDLSLDHLGLITHPEDEKPPGEIATGLADIVDRIGDELQKLSGNSYLTPKDKAGVLIRAHKIVVDGLAELPPVELRPEGEPYRPPLQEPQQKEEKVSEDVPLVPIRSRSSASSSSSHPLAEIAEQESPSASPSLSNISDPLTAVAASETTENATPVPFGTSTPPESSSMPQLVLTDTTESGLLKEAMSDSVMTVTGQPLSRDPSASSKSPDPQPKANKPSTSGADLILPIIIYAVVKSNPPQLASQLMYLRRYRSAICLTGEASYAIVNLTAVVEFLEHVDLAELGLGNESDKVISVHDLSPIGLDYLDESNADAASIASASSRLRGRVFQVSELAGTAAGSANKVISGVMDSSWSALRGLISTTANAATPEVEGDAATTTADASRPGMRPRQASSFSLASVTASVANIAAAAAARNRSRASSRASEQVHQWNANQELQEVTSRPASIKERAGEYRSSDEEDESSTESGGEDVTHVDGDASVHAKEKIGADKEEPPKAERASLSNRLASIGVLGRLSNPAGSGGGAGGISANASVLGPSTAAAGYEISAGASPSPGDTGIIAAASGKPASYLANLTTRSVPLSQTGSTHTRRSSLLGGSIRPDLDSRNSPQGSVISLPPAGGGIGTTEPPIERFMTCDLDEIKLSEIGDLLRDYRRLGTIVNDLKLSQQQ